MHHLPNVCLAACVTAFIIVIVIFPTPWNPWNPWPISPLSIALSAQATFIIGVLAFQLLQHLATKR